MEMTAFVAMGKDELVTRPHLSDPRTILPLDQPGVILAHVPQMAPYHMEFVLAAYYTVGLAVPIEILRAFIRNEHRGVRLLAVTALVNYSALPEDLLAELRKLYSGASDDIERGILRETLTRFAAFEDEGGQPEA